jgi:hypothetical protein
VHDADLRNLSDASPDAIDLLTFYDKKISYPNELQLVLWRIDQKPATPGPNGPTLIHSYGKNV